MNFCKKNSKISNEIIVFDIQGVSVPWQDLGIFLSISNLCILNVVKMKHNCYDVRVLNRTFYIFVHKNRVEILLVKE